MKSTFKLYGCYLKKTLYSCFKLSEIDFDFRKIIIRRALLIESSLFRTELDENLSKREIQAHR